MFNVFFVVLDSFRPATSGDRIAHCVFQICNFLTSEGLLRAKAAFR